MSDFIMLHDKNDHAEFAIRAANIREIFDTGIQSGTQACFDSGNNMSDMYVEESVSEILRLIERTEIK